MPNPFVDVRLPAVALCSFVLSVLHLENASCETIRPGVSIVFATNDQTVTMTWSGIGDKIHNNNCNVKGILVLTLQPPKNEQFQPIYAKSKPWNGSSLCRRDHYKDRGDIVFNNSSVNFTLSKVNRGDQNLYCLKVQCSGADDIVDCLDNSYYLKVTEKVKTTRCPPSGPHSFRQDVKTLQSGTSLRTNAVIQRSSYNVEHCSNNSKTSSKSTRSTASVILLHGVLVAASLLNSF